MNKRPNAMLRQFGFSLLEMVIALVIMSILSGIIVMFIKRPIDSYIDVERRADLTYLADNSLQRLVRDVQQAAPNTIRVRSVDQQNACFRYVPVIGGGRYRQALDASSAGDILDFTKADNSFDVLASYFMPNFADGNIYHMVISNYGIPGADLYDVSAASSHNRAKIASSSTNSVIQLTAPNHFKIESPNKRFYIIPDYSVEYSCSAGKLYRSIKSLPTNGLPSLNSCSNSGDLLVDHITYCSFDYVEDNDAADTSIGALTVRFELNQEGESVKLYKEVFIDNAP